MADNIVLGAGSVSVTLIDDSGALSGAEIPLGDTPSASLAIETERLTVRAADGADPDRRLVDVVTRRTQTFRCQIQSMSNTLSALWLGAVDDGASIGSYPGSSSVTETFAGAQTGRWYQLGTGSKAATGLVLAISTDPALAWYAGDAAQGDAKTADTEYEVEPGTGRVKVKADDGLTDGVFTVTYTPIEARRLTPSGRRSKVARPPEVAVRYIEHAMVGEGRNIYIDRAIVLPADAWALKSRTEPQALSLEMEVTGTLWIDSVTV